MPSMEAHHRVNGADTGKYSGGRQIKKCPGPHLYINIFFLKLVMYYQKSTNHLLLQLEKYMKVKY